MRQVFHRCGWSAVVYQPMPNGNENPVNILAAVCILNEEGNVRIHWIPLLSFDLQI